jgi:CheY-like chemotaxis protein
MLTPRVLIVEDNDAMRAVWVDSLEALGYEVTAVDDGARALEALPQFQPDVILLDLIMPRAEIDGFDFLLELRAGSCGSATPVVVVSGLGEPLAAAVREVPVTALGITAILAKPVTLDTLARTMARATHADRDMHPDASR